MKGEGSGDDPITLNNCTPMTPKINFRRRYTRKMVPIVFMETTTHDTTCCKTTVHQEVLVKLSHGYNKIGLAIDWG